MFGTPCVTIEKLRPSHNHASTTWQDLSSVLIKYHQFPFPSLAGAGAPPSPPMGSNRKCKSVHRTYLRGFPVLSRALEARMPAVLRRECGNVCIGVFPRHVLCFCPGKLAHLDVSQPAHWPYGWVKGCAYSRDNLALMVPCCAVARCCLQLLQCCCCAAHYAPAARLGRRDRQPRAARPPARARAQLF